MRYNSYFLASGLALNGCIAAGGRISLWHHTSSSMNAATFASSTLVALLFLFLAVFIRPTESAVSQESQIHAIQALLRDSKFSDVVAKLSLLPQVQQHVQELAKQPRNVLDYESRPGSLANHAAIQFLHQMCLDAAEHVAARVIHACFAYIVQQDGERTAQ